MHTNVKSKLSEIADPLLTITSYFGFLLVALTITSALFIDLSKIRLI